MPRINAGRSILASRVVLAIACACATAVVAAGAAWPWSGSVGAADVSLLIIGDIQVHTRRADPTTAFTNVQDTLTAADLVYANLEGVLVKSTGPDVDIPDKKSWTHPGPGGAKALKASGIDVVGLANNVAYGRQNIVETMRLLDEHRIAHAGAGRNIDEAHTPAIVERKGVKIGFLQYTARWYREDQQMATASEPGVARLSSKDGVSIDPGDLERVKGDIRRLRSRADIVIVSHHNRDGGTPVQFGPQPERPRGSRPDRTKAEEYQRQFARTALDTGADMVFGHGTHTVQGAEVYKGKPILYAIGHSAFDQPGYEKSTDGLVVRVIVRDKEIAKVSFVPVSRDGGNNVLMLDPSSGEGARLVGIVRGVSPGVPLRIDRQEVVLLEPAATSTQ